MGQPLPVEQVDPEFAELIRSVTDGRIRAFVKGNRVYHGEPRYERRQELLWKRRKLREVTLEVGRNDPCVCGSGRKFKKCCGRAK